MFFQPHRLRSNEHSPFTATAFTGDAAFTVIGEIASVAKKKKREIRKYADHWGMRQYLGIATGSVKKTRSTTRMGYCCQYGKQEASIIINHTGIHVFPVLVFVVFLLFEVMQRQQGSRDRLEHRRKSLTE